jgi:hypothetical protein
MSIAKIFVVGAGSSFAAWYAYDYLPASVKSDNNAAEAAIIAGLAGITAALLTKVIG